MFVFLDESGNFTGDKNSYFIVRGFVTGNPLRTAKSFRKWQRTKFPRKLRYKNEVKFNDTGLNNEFEMLKLDLLPKLSPKSLLQVEAVDSTANPNIQIADWICGALFRYYNKGKNGERLFITLKNNIVASDELFKDYWTNKKSR